MHHSIKSVTRSADTLAAVWSGGERTDLPYLWLRDNCNCEECRVVQTNDFTSYTWPPSVQALHMLVNECEGGESTVVDGFGQLNELRNDHPGKFEVLCAVPVPFRLFSEEYECYAANPIVELDSGGGVRMLRFNTQQMQAIALSEPRLGDFYAACHELSRRVNDPSAQVSFRLEGGQILLCAGHPVLHGRMALRSNGQRHLQDVYFEHDNVRNHLRLLRRAGRI